MSCEHTGSILPEVSEGQLHTKVLNQAMSPPLLLYRMVLLCPLSSVLLLAFELHLVPRNGNMASAKDVASDTYVTGYHLLMLFFDFCPRENKACLITLTQDNRSGSQIHVCDIICLSTCRFRLLSAWDIDFLLSQLPFVFQDDAKGLY